MFWPVLLIQPTERVRHCLFVVPGSYDPLVLHFRSRIGLFDSLIHPNLRKCPEGSGSTGGIIYDRLRLSFVESGLSERGIELWQRIIFLQWRKLLGEKVAHTVGQ